ncbi:hypothetical protein JMUB7523_26540 [Staphylococcus aureus]
MFFCEFASGTRFFFNDTATTEIYTRKIVGSVRCVSDTGVNVTDVTTATVPLGMPGQLLVR